MSFQQFKDGSFTVDPLANMPRIPFEIYQEKGGDIAGDFILELDTSIAEADLEPLKDHIKNCKAIDISTPVYTDGRNFSLARLLREVFAYEGDIRALGPLYPDQLTYLLEVGFSSLLLTQEQIDHHGEKDWIDRSAAVELRYQMHTKSEREDIWAARHRS